MILSLPYGHDDIALYYKLIFKFNSFYYNISAYYIFLQEGGWTVDGIL